MSTKIICTSNQIGGMGKTTVTALENKPGLKNLCEPFNTSALASIHCASILRNSLVIGVQHA